MILLLKWLQSKPVAIFKGNIHPLMMNANIEEKEMKINDLGWYLPALPSFNTMKYLSKLF